jgi:UDP-2,4-diacetamido-2,4,6-trideoxy-beta-L-altropyranose hydrolase
MNNILIRTGGGRAKGKELGLGHIYRTINLAKELKYNKIYFSLEDFGGAKEILQKNGFNKIETVMNKIKTEQDFKNTKLQIEKWKIDIVIIDRYKISKLYVKKLSKIIKVVIISDLLDLNFKANLIVNGFIGFKNQITKNKLNSKCMIGPNFQILNKEFSKMNKKNIKKWDLLISFGGYDEKNIIEIILKILPDYLNKLKVKIILGPVAKKNSELNKLQKKYSKNLHVKNSTKNMAKEMRNTKYGLCTGGLTTYEFACMKIPTGIISDDNHQIITAKQWQKLGFAKNLGIINKNSESKIRIFVDKVYERKFLTRNRKRMVDGLGSKRVANEILKMKENH